MQVQKKGSVVLAAVLAVLAIGALLFMGLRLANNQAISTAVSPTQTVVRNTPTNQPTLTTSGAVDTQLQSIDTKMGGLDTYQKNIDNAINDQPIDTGL